METAIKAFVRCEKLDEAMLDAMEEHGRGEGYLADKRSRKDAGVIRGIAGAISKQLGGWSFKNVRVGSNDPRLKLRDRYNVLVEATGASLRKGAPIGLHLLVGVSPEWIEAEGGLHDPKNPRNKMLVRAATRWATEELGGTFAARMDLNEDGGAVVDVFLSPTREGKNKRKWISTNKSLKELQHKYPGERTSYGALQSSWTAFAAEHLDQAIIRGTIKKDTRKENLSPEEYARMVEEVKDSPKEELILLLQKQAAKMEKMAHQHKDEVDRLQGDILELKQTVKRLTGLIQGEPDQSDRDDHDGPKRNR